ncbi:MAG: hypothetical protein O7E52_22920, partial [Candidatus Poribacteria bacterium]|nr:hypothetical protein [Candidatus Poribacteria bacterium]
KMFEQILDRLTSDELLDVNDVLTGRMRRRKGINPLNPFPQTEAIELCDELLEVVDRLQAAIEAKYQTKIDQISDEDEEEIEKQLSEIREHRFHASPKYDPERGKKLVEELMRTIPYHKSLRYGHAKRLEEFEKANRSKDNF